MIDKFKNIFRNISFFATIVVAVSILFFLPNYKAANADRPASFYGISVSQTSLFGANNALVQAPAGQYINGNYIYVSAATSSTGLFYDVSGSSSGNYSSGGYSGSYSSRLYGGSEGYDSGNYSATNYGSGGYGQGNTYGSASYSGSSYGGKSYGSFVYSGQSQAAGVAYAKCEPYLKSYLGYGRANNPDEVKKLQEFLNKNEGEKLSVNSVFDLATLEAVKRFQDKYAKDVLQDSWGLSCNTGYVYITTLAKVNDIVCNISTDFRNIPLPDSRPVFRCSGEIDSVTKEPEPCTAVIAPTATSTSATTTDSNNNLATSTWAAGVGFFGKIKSLWKDAITD